ncbi:CCAAT/enhancer-binding protein zeta-like [Ornithodoros turicata]|uniref:CCAAT/enhancer-binding protein zeta-like n=1 Tax=Ornithodoros turicata TaxID=34597 RepID=UPI0031390D92
MKAKTTHPVPESKGYKPPAKMQSKKVNFETKNMVAGKRENGSTTSSTFGITHNTLLAKPGKKWYEQLPEGKSTGKVQNETEDVILKRRLAQALHQHDGELYKKHTESRSRRSEMQWVHTVLSKGTLADKVAAHTLLIQDSPVHNLSSLDTLISMVSPKGKKECLMAMDGLRDLFLSDLLKPDAKLKAFSQRPLGEVHSVKDVGDSKKLLLWHFEDLLKNRYVTFLEAVEKVSFDQVDKMKLRAVACMYHLLAHNPEQEQRLLEHLVNKLGDRMHSVASRASHFLTQLTGQHPLIKPAVVAEVERLLYRPNISPKAQYYGLCFLSQLLLSDDEGDLARQLVRLYFGFFKKCAHAGEADSRTLRVLLTGVNRAFPYARSNDPDGTGAFLDDHLDIVFRMVHLADFNVSVQSLMLIYQVLDTRSSFSDRFYNAMYRKLLDPAIEHSHFQAMFLNLLYQSLNRDTEIRRVKAFLKRLLQGCMYLSPHIVCGVMILISELQKAKPKVLETTFLDNGACQLQEDEEEEHYEDAPNDSDEDENVEDKSAESNESKSGGGNGVSPQEEKDATPSWVHVNLHPQKAAGRDPRSYDPWARNPLYCGAEYSMPWELNHLAHHHHPSVALFAKHILHGTTLSYPGDPLQDFTLARFLDRFVYRNPKKQVPTEQEAKDSADAVFGKRRHYRPSGVRKLSVLSRDYMNLAPGNIPPEERFLYRYFHQTGLADKKKKKRKGADDDADSVASDDVERLLDLCEPEFDKELDFAGDFASRNKKKGTTKQASDDSEESEDDLDIDLDEEEVDLGDLQNDEEFQGAFKEFEGDIAEAKTTGGIREEDIEFSGDDEFGEPMSAPKKKHALSYGIGKKGNSFSLNGLLASAEQFSHLLDENATSGVDTTSTKALSNKDNASVKQLKWEMERDAWVRGQDWRSRKRKHGGARTASRRGKFGTRGKKR